MKNNIVSCFEDTASHFPDKTAVVFNDQVVTFRELNEKANILAHFLISEGIGVDDIVALMVERSIERIIGILGILKARAAYFPLSLSDPAMRINELLKDSGCKLVLTLKKHSLHYGVGHKLYALKEVILKGSLKNPNLKIRNHDLAYVIYTSGSTGRPKGVMVEHKSLIHRLLWMQKKYSLDHNDVLLQKTPYTFDVSIWELMWWMITGSSLVMLKMGMEKLPMAILEETKKHRVSVMHFVPSMLGVFLYYTKETGQSNKLVSLVQMFCSGEELKSTHVRQFNKVLGKTNETKLTNLYGPTEATIDVTFYDIDLTCIPNRIPIGKPIDLHKAFLVENNKQVADGEIGELWISGIGVARGYLNRPFLTAEKFRVFGNGVPERVYKTGDLMRRLSDGNLEYLGRVDHQVKIHGIRIELGEIERVLTSHPKISDGVVTVKEYNDQIKILVAYLVSDIVKVSDLKIFLKERLPEYMVPKEFVFLDTLPLNKNGKLNRSLLPTSPKIGII